MSALPIVLILFCLAGWALFGLPRHQRDVGPPDGHQEIAVKTVRVKRVTAPLIFPVVGDLRPTNEVIVTSRIGGRLATVRYGSGDRIRKGTVVATIHSADLSRRTAQLVRSISVVQANRLAKENSLVTAENQLEEKRRLFTRDLIPRVEVEEAQSAVEAAKAQVDLAGARLSQEQALLEQARALMALTELVAPISGVVTRRLIEPGAEVEPSTAVLTIASLNELKTTLRVPSSELSFIRKGTVARLAVDGISDDNVSGTVTAVQQSEINPNDSAVEVTFSTPGRMSIAGENTTISLMPDMPHDALVIPRSAIVDLGNKTYVYRIAGDRALRTEIALAGNYEDLVAVVKGLSDGESIVIEPASSLLSGSRVRVHPATF